MRRIALIAVFLIAAAAPAMALSFPPPQNDYVSDYAEVLSEQDSEAIFKLFERVEDQTGIEITLVTIASLSDYEATNLRTYAANLFDTWGVGDKKKNNGVLILFSKGDREVWIEMGAGYRNYFDADLQTMVDAKMLPYFKAGEYSRGLYQGAHGVANTVTKEVTWLSFYKWHLILGALAVICVLAGISCFRNGEEGWGYVFFSLALALIVFILTVLPKAGGKGRSGFGGGRSGGGGAGGKW